MKLSWIVVTGPKSLREEACKRLEIISDTYLSASTPIQNAIEPWLQFMPKIQNEIKCRIKENYEYLKTFLFNSSQRTPSPARPSPLPLRLYPVEGGWSAILKMPGKQNDEHWALTLLEKSNLVVHPGYLFDFSDDVYLVLSLLVAENDFRRGTELIANHM